jgi:diguanylate cyclase (GGDEF)-like protein/PAS domain S-box-containing protein
MAETAMSVKARATSGGHGRVRAAMYGAFALLALLVAWQVWYANRFEQMRAVDADVVNLAGLQRAYAQKLGRLALLATESGPADAQPWERLGRTLDQARSDAMLLEALLARPGAERAEGAVEANRALAQWQQARERLWSRTAALLNTAQDARTASGAASSTWHDRVIGAGRLVLAEVDGAHAAAHELVMAHKTQATLHSQHQLRLTQWGGAAGVLILVLLALAVVEPTVRAVRRQHERLAAQSAQLRRLALVAERTQAVVMITDHEDRVVWVNQGFTALTGWTFADVVGRPPAELLTHPESDPDGMARLFEALASGTGIRLDLLNRKRDGSGLWLDVDIQPLHDGAGRLEGFVSVSADITERRRMQEQLARSARTDELTGLPNRAAVLERIGRAVEHARRHPGYGFAVLFMDFDRFKQVNDTLGHSVGDELLRQIAGRLELALRPGDALARVGSSLHTAARIGGDEFVVVLEGTRSADDARAVAERLLRVLADPYVVGSVPVQSGVSIGIVTSDQAAEDAEAVLRDADTAMYEAKRAGRGRCVMFDGSMHERLVRTMALETDLRRALRQRELFVVYQPVVDLGTGLLAGVEALVRWRHPERGVVPPAQFIAVAEEAGLIGAIGDVVLASACAQFARWRRELGAVAPRRVAVNLSRAQLQVHGLVAGVERLLREHGMEAPELQLEVTESLAAQDEAVQTTLRALKNLGVQLALDDFGTGYSSLACLHQLPVDTVKIDRSFVAHAETVEYHRVLIEATIRVARTLGMTTVAEGIETASQAALMECLHCDRGQGWLFGRPMAPDDLARWVQDRAAVTADELAAGS